MPTSTARKILEYSHLYHQISRYCSDPPTIHHINKFGVNDAVGTAFEDIWLHSTDITFVPTGTAETITVASSGQDTVDGTGARTVKIEGLSVTGAEITETVTLNASSAPTTVNQYWRINRAYCVGVGTGGINAATITFTGSSSGTQATIGLGMGQTQKTQYTVPLGKTAFVINTVASVGKNDDGVVNLMTRNIGESWRVRRIIKTYQSSVSLPMQSFIGPIAALSDIKMMAKTGAGGLSVSGEYDLIICS